MLLFETYLTFYKYIRVIEVIRSEDGLVRKAKVEYRIPSLKKKEIIVDIRRKITKPKIFKIAKQKYIYMIFFGIN